MCFSKRLLHTMGEKGLSDAVCGLWVSKSRHHPSVSKHSIQNLQENPLQLLFPCNKTKTRKKRHFIVKSLRLANALCHLHAFFCVHCAWLGRNLLSYPSPSLLLQSKASNSIKSEVQRVQSLGQRKENKLREAADIKCSYCIG